MRFKIRMFSVMAAMAMFLSFGAAEVFAETGHSSDATVSFTEGTGPTSPVDPENPDEDKDGGEPVYGSLAIVYASDFAFGSGVISSKPMYYDIVTPQPNVQVVDLRGTLSGWELDASVSAFANEAGQPSLPGAVIHIQDGRLNSTSDDSYAPDVHTQIALKTDGSTARILTAQPGKGGGLWVERFYPDGTAQDALVQLEIPAGAAELGAHTATITWTLSNTPGDAG
ncbi:MAG: WxL domain-containing protein [Clostridiales bacterium]|nr:WxL domain-containing protein [Clostridiales bacterium]